MPQQVLLICQPFTKQKGKFLPGQAQSFPEAAEGRARNYADKLFATGRYAGVVLARQSADIDTGDYSEPEYLEQLGDVPGLDLPF